ncbi:MAG: DNA cytosine methyltransferase [Ruminococcaceae bacterium]|nr:DNA cytosine methyltransferase [Oscillospiraceae bacterium]
MLEQELVVDNFAGGGGASTGIEMAIGRSVDIAINHDPDAIAMHRENHPTTKHYCEDVWEVDPVEACGDKSVALAWFSPDCKHFSRAKGGKPVDKKIRGLAWVAIKWAYLVRPRVIMMENVPEIMTWGPLGEDNKPIKERMGETFDGFLAALSFGLSRSSPAFHEMCEALGVSENSDIALACERGLGYDIQYRELKSCDYGAPTTRTRFYMIARCDGKPIVWPAPTHGDKRNPKVKDGTLLPYRTAAECIDWSIPAKSIFERDKPLAENTLRRIAKGIQKFVIDNPEPFIVHYKFDNEPESIDAPLSTVTAVNSHYVVTPTIMCNNTNNNGASADSPLPTVTTGNRNFVVTPTIVPIGYGERKGQEPRVNSVEDPLGTIVSSGKHYLAMPSLIQYHSETSEDEVRGQELTEPLMTVDTSPRYALSVANIMKNYGGNYQGSGSAVDEPLDTVTAKDHNSLVTAHILTMRNNMDGQAVDEPITTISCKEHHAEVQAFLVKYFSGEKVKPVDAPLDTITTKDRFAVVTVHGEEYIITDIKMRMLTPRELFKAQGFPSDYIIDTANGKPYPKSKQVARCGNAVTPPVPAALVRANLLEV